MTGPQVLAAAAALIRKSGWTRFKAKRDGRYCAMGAVRAVTGGDPYAMDRAVEVLKRRLARAGFPSTLSVTGWNDSRRAGRSGRVEVLRMLDAGSAPTGERRLRPLLERIIR